MSKSELKRLCTQDPVGMAYKMDAQEQEIERLNTQVAMMSDALESILGAAEEEEDEEAWYIAVRKASLARLKNTVAWLATHDRQVRDAALEDAASFCDNQRDISGRLCSGHIRAMKGEKQ